MSKKQMQAGYKSTELGLLPADWQVNFLENLVVRNSGHTPDKEVESYYDGGIKWISLADSWRLDEGLIDQTEIEISTEGLNNSSAVILPAGTVVMTRDAGVGKVGIMAEPMAVSQHFIAWTCNDSFDNWFLYYWLLFKKKYFEKQAVGSTIKTIGLPLFKRLQVANPPISEQHKIAAILSTWDKAIALEKKVIANLGIWHRALKLKLLSGEELRSKGFKAEWETTTIGAFLQESRTVVADSCSTRRIKVRLQVKGVEARKARGTEAEDATMFYKRKAGQFIYGKQNLHKGAFGIIPEELDGYYSSQDIPALDFDESKINPQFFLFLMARPKFYEGLARIATGTGAKRIHSRDFLKIKIALPSLEEQNAIAEILLASQKEITSRQQHLAVLQAQKRGLMQKLLTGTIRVKTP